MKYSCYCCNYETEYKSSIDKHKLTNKHITKYKTNKYCEICKKLFSTIGNYKIHYNREHIINIQDIPDIPDIPDIQDIKVNKQSNKNIIKNLINKLMINL